MYSTAPLINIETKNLIIVKTYRPNRVLGITTDKDGNPYTLIDADNDFYYEQGMRDIDNLIARLNHSI